MGKKPNEKEKSDQLDIEKEHRKQELESDEQKEELSPEQIKINEKAEKRAVKRAKRMKRKIRWRYGILITANVLIIGMLIWQLFSLDQNMTQINNQLTYLMDTNSIMQTNLGTLQDNIRATLEEEASLMADYSITETDMDMNAGTYTVAINVSPKEYTDSTKTSIYFGTQEYALELIDHSFQGTVTLPLSEAFDGNVTMLFINGEKKSTEVLKNYVGFPHMLENVISGSLSEFPTYKDGKLTIGGETAYTLSGNETFDFTSVQMIVTASDQTVYTGDLLSGQTVMEDDVPDSNGEEIPQDTEEDTEVQGENISGNKGTFTVADPIDIEPGTKISIYLKAQASNGCTFQYQVFEGITATTEDAANPNVQVEGWQEADDYLPYIYTVFDNKGGSKIL